MRFTPIAAAVSLSLSISACTTTPGLNLPSQADAGRGAATGVVIASGCKAGAGTIAGGVFGGVIGSQIGKGNGKNAMAGIGAALGAWLGSDCNPAANPARSEPLPNMAPLVINGLKLTPMTGFSPEAFAGVPPIVTPADIRTAGEVVRRFSNTAKQAQAAGNTELALVSMYWAKRISSVAFGVLSASMQSIASNQGTTLTVPAKALIILPGFNHELTDTQQALAELSNSLARPSYGSVDVADNGGFAAGLDYLNKQRNTIQLAQNTALPPQIKGFPKNVVMKLPDGTQVLKTDDALTVYNPNDRPISLPLEKLTFMPRTPVPSAARIESARLMLKMRSAFMNFSFGSYGQQNRSFDAAVIAPNTIIDRQRGNKAIAYFGETGDIVMNSQSGTNAYRRAPAFKAAVDAISSIDYARPTRDFFNLCKNLRLGQFDSLSGTYANKLESVCYAGSYAAPNKLNIKNFYIGEGRGDVVQTMESLMRDKTIQKVMNDALAHGDTISNLLSFAPGVGNVESGLQCAGSHTLAQQQFVSSALGGRALDKAKLAGWTPAPSGEWDLGRVANCVGAIPLAGTAASVVKVGSKLAARAGVEVLSGLGGRLDQVKKVVSMFETPTSFNGYMRGVSNVREIMPNQQAASFVKTVYDMLMTGQSLSQTWQGGSNLLSQAL